MTTITREWLQKTIADMEVTRDDIPFGLDDDDATILIVLKRALASLERELVRHEHAGWSDKTFGCVGPVGPLKHLSQEALEAAAIPSDLLEWADMQFLLWDAQRRAGISDAEITAAMEEKLKVNMARQWPEPEDGEPRLHIKEQPAPWHRMNAVNISVSCTMRRKSGCLNWHSVSKGRRSTSIRIPCHRLSTCWNWQFLARVKNPVAPLTSVLRRHKWPGTMDLQSGCFITLIIG